ncbi:hypothetical protein EGW08_015749 [Elysia chlorotica]|uniref:BZIP domain-containing protein n=1 Tax=Elysia chlorotica TaxID=188477 RepID=A0A433T4M4_ELYCH|nr:hypothetical protein EGW08_015749 [Elysia chlorotica]
MTMSEGALDLSISSQPSQRAPPGDHGGSDSGRASTDSAGSEHHDEVIRQPRLLAHQPPQALPPPQHAQHAQLHRGGGGVSPPHSLGPQAHGDSAALADYSPGLGPRAYNRSPIGREREPAELLSPGHLYKPPAHLLPTFASSAGGGGSSLSRSPPSPPPPHQSQVLPGSPPTSALPLGHDSFDDGKPPLHSLASDRISTTSNPPSNPDARVAPIRPFKMYPRKRRAESRSDSSNSSSGVSSAVSTSVSGSGSSNTAQSLISTSSAVTGDNSGSVTTSSPASPGKRGGENDSSAGSDGEKRMRGSSPTSNDSSGAKKDDAYWDRRRKNNEAAKRSRDARRQKEEEIAMRAAFLEQENLKLRAQVAILKNETAKLHYMLYNRI